MQKRALVTGVSGQDGSYIAELLLEKRYDVYGLVRRSSVEHFERIEHIKDKIHLICGDLHDQLSLDKAIEQSQPDECYNLAAQSFVKASFDQPILTADYTGLGVLRLLDSIKRIRPDCKFLQASSSEMFGKVHETPQKETTPFHPRSPYGVAKVFGHYTVQNYREAYNMFACSSICFNHESKRRGLEFVTRKITDGVARIQANLSKELVLGDLEAKRDWGHSRDYVNAMWMMLQNSKPEDFVISTGETHSVREFCEIAFKLVNLDYQKYVKQDKTFMRPSDVNLLLGDSSKIREELGWQPEISFTELVTEMLNFDLKRYNLRRN